MLDDDKNAAAAHRHRVDSGRLGAPARARRVWHRVLTGIVGAGAAWLAAGPAWAQSADELSSPRLPAPYRLAPSRPALCGPAQGTGTGVGAAPAAVAGTAPPALRNERLLGAGRVPPRRKLVGPVYARADRMGGELNVDTWLEGKVELRHDALVLHADRAIYHYETDEVQAFGKIHLVEHGTSFDGPSLAMRIEAETGSMPEASYRYEARNGHGDAKLVEFLSQDDIRLHQATYTTCDPREPAWWVRANRMDIDQTTQEAASYDTTMYFEGVPIFYWPYEMDFPLGNDRRSGFLSPSFGQSSNVGPIFTFPYYWNIAPNRDATITPEVLTERGVALDNEFRFLEPHARGLFEYDILDHDRITGTMRDHILAQSTYDNAQGLRFNLNFNRVSDDAYFTNFSTNIASSSQEVLPQEASISYVQPYWGYWGTQLSLSKSQTLVSLLAQSDPGPYERVPDLKFNFNRSDWHGFDVAGVVDATRFQHPAINPCFAPPDSATAGASVSNPCPQPTVITEPYSKLWFSQDGSRLVVNPSLSYPLLAPGWFIVPKVQWHYTEYSLDPTYNDGATSATRSLPIGSVDSGLVFERPTSWLGQSAQQTLEPRLFYALVPYRNQNLLPNFDSADADFNFAQLFTENTFTGSDRIAEANEITAAVTTRMIDDATGAERFRVAFGQRFYFGPQYVTLPGDIPRTNKESDTLFVGSASLGRKWAVDVGLDYSSYTSQLALATFGLRWQPAPASVLNVSYRYEIASLAGTTLPINQPRVSFQWPLTRRWYAVGVVDYAISDRALAQAVAGFEYKSDCWVARIALSRYAITEANSLNLTGNYSSSYFLQIEFNGLAGVGFNPLETLQSNIPGYQRVNPPPAPAGPFDYYQ